jgi:hypothetical protein
MNALAVIALSKRLRTLIARGSHRSELLETCDLLDVAIESPDTQTPAPPPALTPSLPPDPPPESKSETSQPMQSEGGAGASLPSGWIAMSGHLRDGACLHSATGSQVRDHLTRGWFWVSGIDPCDGNECLSGRANSRDQAMCAALGIELLDSPNTESGGWTRVWLCSLVTDSFGAFVRFYDPDDCARAALERYHAQQSKPSAPAAEWPECKCWQLPAGGRQANRWCSLHAAEWQTFAEQSAGELDPRERGVHPDGTSRAGCDVCEGGKR